MTLCRSGEYRASMALVSTGDATGFSPSHWKEWHYLLNGCYAHRSPYLLQWFQKMTYGQDDNQDNDSWEESSNLHKKSPLSVCILEYCFLEFRFRILSYPIPTCVLPPVLSCTPDLDSEVLAAKPLNAPPKTLPIPKAINSFKNTKRIFIYYDQTRHFVSLLSLAIYLFSSKVFTFLSVC